MIALQLTTWFTYLLGSILALAMMVRARRVCGPLQQGSNKAFAPAYWLARIASVAAVVHAFTRAEWPGALGLAVFLVLMLSVFLGAIRYRPKARKQAAGRLSSSLIGGSIDRIKESLDGPPGYQLATLLGVLLGNGHFCRVFLPIVIDAEVELLEAKVVGNRRDKIRARCGVWLSLFLASVGVIVLWWARRLDAIRELIGK